MAKSLPYPRHTSLQSAYSIFYYDFLGRILLKNVHSFQKSAQKWTFDKVCSQFKPHIVMTRIRQNVFVLHTYIYKYMDSLLGLYFSSTHQKVQYIHLHCMDWSYHSFKLMLPVDVDQTMMTWQNDTLPALYVYYYYYYYLLHLHIILLV